MDCVLAVDVGTQSLKAGIVSRDNGIEIIESNRMPLKREIGPGGHVEMDAEAIWKALVSVCSGFKQIERVSSLVFSTLCPSLIPIDGNGNALHPVIIHQDRRSNAQARHALETVGEDTFLNINGNLPVPGGISLTSLLWLKENRPEIYDKSNVCFGHIATFLLRRLCGDMLIDPSNASFTGLYDTVGCSGWHQELCGPLDIDPGKLPAVRFSNTIAGELGAGAAAELGLRAGLPVVTGANDTTCAAAGAGAVNPGDLMNTSGTVDILAVCMNSPLVSRGHLLRTHAYPGKWLAMRTVGAGGGSLEWFRTNFCREMKRDYFYGAYLSEVMKTNYSAVDEEPPVVFEPFLTGDRHSTESRRAAFGNLTLKSGRDEMLSAMLHGIVDFQFAALGEWKESIRLSRKIYHVGGGAQPSYTAFKQWKLDGYELIELGETALPGAAVIAFETLDAERL